MPGKEKQAAFEKVYLEPDNRLFSEVMSNDKKYVIPRFQRDYSWDSDHWDELWRDIEQMRANRTQHFMGYLVFQTTDGKTFQVIDGQQRLTTLSLMILAALGKLKTLIDSDVEPEANQGRMEIYQKTYIGVADPITLRTEPKLTLNRHNDSHFRTIARELKIVAQRNITHTNRKINKAFEFFTAQFKSCQSGEEVAAMIADVADGLLFTIITVQDDMNAYTVFETLNARGLHLSTPDLLKNYLLSTMTTGKAAYSEEHFHDFEEQWANILEQLGETEFTNFLRSCRGVRRTLVHKGDLFRTLKTDVNSPAKVLPYLEDLKTHAPVYAALQDHHDNFWGEYDGRYSEARVHLEVLEMFNVKTPLSLLMAGFEKLSSQDFVRLLKCIVGVTIRYNVICGKPAREQEPIYNKMANALTNDGVALRDLTDMLSPVYPGSEEFLAAFTTKDMPSRRSPKKIVLLLRKIERQLSGEEPPLTLTLEHVLPFSPDDSWQESFGRNTWENAIDRLGNMALLSESRNMEQESFAEKREVLRDSPYHVNRHIAEYAEWNMDNLQDHQKWLARQAGGIWRIPQLEQRM